MEPRTALAEALNNRVRPLELFRALRGIWTLQGREFVVEIDQETGDLMACTYEAEAVDPRSVVTRGVLVRPFDRHRPGQ